MTAGEVRNPRNSSFTAAAFVLYSRRCVQRVWGFIIRKVQETDRKRKSEYRGNKSILFSKRDANNKSGLWSFVKENHACGTVSLDDRPTKFARRNARGKRHRNCQLYGVFYYERQPRQSQFYDFRFSSEIHASLARLSWQPESPRAGIRLDEAWRERRTTERFCTRLMDSRRK